MNQDNQEESGLGSPAIMLIGSTPAAIDFESDEPLVCSIDGSKPIEGCEACQ